MLGKKRKNKVNERKHSLGKNKLSDPRAQLAPHVKTMACRRSQALDEIAAFFAVCHLDKPRVLILIWHALSHSKKGQVAEKENRNRLSQAFFALSPFDLTIRFDSAEGTKSTWGSGRD